MAMFGTHMNKIFVPVLLLMFTACNRAAQFEHKWQSINIGDDPAKAVQLLGEPDRMKDLQIPFLQARQLVWQEEGKSYTAVSVANAIVAKTSINNEEH